MGHQDEVYGDCLYPFINILFAHSLYQTQSLSEVRYRHTVDAALTIYRTEGIKAFYRGLLPSLLGIMHVAVQFPLYEQLKVWSRECFFCLSKPLN